MTQAQPLVRALNGLVKQPQFSYAKARAAVRKESNVDTIATKTLNAGFNPEVDGCESFVMKDGSVVEWLPGAFRYAERAAH